MSPLIFHRTYFRAISLWCLPESKSSPSNGFPWLHYECDMTFNQIPWIVISVWQGLELWIWWLFWTALFCMPKSYITETEIKFGKAFSSVQGNIECNLGSSYLFSADPKTKDHLYMNVTYRIRLFTGFDIT